MQFFTVASALFAAALAAPAPDPSTYENIDISEFYLRNNNGIQAVGFKLSGNEATNAPCGLGAVPSLPSEQTACALSDYRFTLVKGQETDYGLTIYHTTGSSNKTLTGDIPTHCRAGGDGPNDYFCTQTGEVTIVIV